MDMSAKIRILIVDDHPLFRQGVRFYLESFPDLDLIGEAQDGADALSFLINGTADIVLMDLQMPGMDGVETTKKIKASWPDTKVLVLTTFNSWEKVYTALKAGASGYILKDAPPEELVIAIKGIANGGTYLGAQVATELIDRVRLDQEADSTGLPEPLTDRELEVLKQIGRGLGNREIAAELVLSEKTVKTHVANILQKLQVASRTQAALYAIRNHLV